MRKILFCILALLFVCVSAYADTIVLKSGNKVEGAVLEKTADTIKVNVAGTESVFSLKEVDTINGKKVVISATTTLNKIELPKLTPTQKMVLAVIALVGLTVVVIVILMVYIYSAICLQIIAKKAGSGPGWLAWIPIANLFLICNIIKLRYWYLLIFLAAFLPVIGTLAGLIFWGFLWYKIALVRGKPGWIGALVAIPVFGLIFTGYLAFSK